MKYHAPTKAFTVTADALDGAAMALRYAIKNIREQAGLPLEPHDTEHAMDFPQFAEQGIIDAAGYLGIDLGAKRHGKLDVRDAP